MNTDTVEKYMARFKQHLEMLVEDAYTIELEDAAMSELDALWDDLSEEDIEEVNRQCEKLIPELERVILDDY